MMNANRSLDANIWMKSILNVDDSEFRRALKDELELLLDVEIRSLDLIEGGEVLVSGERDVYFSVTVDGQKVSGAARVVELSGILCVKLLENGELVAQGCTQELSA